MRFKKGQRVVLETHGAGHVTEEDDHTVLWNRKGEVWLDNGPGNDPTGPFDQDGGYLGDLMFGFNFHIRPYNEEG